ncbi:MAG: crotonase/enoyl-CoA hydratase family protein [Acidimicrobiales bacterium]
MDFEEIEYTVEDGIATVALNRPDKLNAGTARMVRELVSAVEMIDGDDDVRVAIVTGNGRAFCAGADLSSGGGTFDYEARRATLGKEPETSAWGGEVPEGLDEEGRRMARNRDGAGLVTLAIFDCRKPIIAAINGPAVGMGATMPLAMDIRMASTSARFGFVFAQRGIVPEGASTWFLPRVVGISQAAEWLYTGRVFDAEEALAGGLLRSVHEPDDLLPAARALAAEIAKGAPVSVALTRRMLWRMLGADHPMEAHRVDTRGVMATGELADAREGVLSFLEKRSPEFQMRVSQDFPDIFPGWTDPTFS